MANFNVEVGPSATPDDAALVQAELVSIPARLKTTIDRKRIKVAACRDHVMNFDPDEFSEPPEGWPPRLGWDDVPGAYIPSTRTVVVATIDAGGQRRVPRRGEMHGSFSLAVHELIHGLDDAMNTVSNSRAFKRAWQADEDEIGAEDTPSYYLREGTGKRESFAESGARRFGLDADAAPLWPAIEAYWDSVIDPRTAFRSRRLSSRAAHEHGDDIIGVARETAAGSLILMLNAVGPNGASGHARLEIPGGDPRIAGIRPAMRPAAIRSSATRGQADFSVVKSTK